MTGNRLLVTLAIGVVAALVGLAVLLRDSGAPPATAPDSRPEGAGLQAAEVPQVPRARRATDVAAGAPAQTPGADEDPDEDIDEDSAPPDALDSEPAGDSWISGRASAALRMDVRPEVEACVEASSDPGALAGASVSVTIDVSARSGRYVLASPAVASRGLRDPAFFACIEERLDGLSFDAPDGQESADSQRLTFPYRVP